MKVLIDTNIILDVFCKRPDFYEDSAKVFKLCEVKRISGVISALSIPNIMYILRKELDAKKTKEILDNLSLIFSIADLKADDLKKAADMGFKDYEDAVQSACAARIKANYIITRNIRDFTMSKVAAIRPIELLERV
ncbi:PIN domain-containing protein [uncultured Acetatifactor sp.]|jgi:predicted nucleic acid-binding protein|uniref:type II toxin-antitoxin system VapC family toxin n=1 Tax=uncultured Acetatifactor sp. TaxID=1671927 RepID=UPI0026110DD4|nr:PIN domain-containing protein [uncultured Acetatifactor sp.]